MEDIGFIGVGLMGGGMARNLLKAGYGLSVIAHRNRAQVEALVAAGASEVKNLEDMAKASDIIHICAPGSPQVEAIVEELLPHLRVGAVIVDCSTSDPVSTASLAAKIGHAGGHLVDAPLGGTPVQADAGELTAIIGASPDVYDRVEPVIGAWAGQMLHLGPTGAGHKMKLLNNMLSLGYGALYSEALALAEKVGITTHQFDSVIRGSRMDCGFYQTFIGHTIDGNRESHKFTLTNALKDATYLESMANSVGLHNPVGNAIKGSLALAMSAGGTGPEDYLPHLVDYVAARNDVALSPPKTPAPQTPKGDAE
ncbi:MAG: NAD(P)-dependent oxidoreductase [Marinovum sp.]|nr:NAD(P)-dependent oxidoreductase [Marinovum sp.]